MAEDPLAELADLAVRLGARCTDLGLRVATVESCTGGLVGHLITEVPGSSAYFVGGFVTYSDDLKRQAAGVPDEVLAAHGAVSAQVAVAMATGGRQRTAADLAVSVTGIAGPDGGSPAKPVGLTYVAVADRTGSVVRRSIPAGAIVAGNPAREIGRRFSDEQVEALLRIRWWDWPTETVTEHVDLLSNPDVDGFIARFDPGP